MTRFELADSDLGGWLLVASRSQLAGAMSLNLRHQCDNHDICHQCSGMFVIKMIMTIMMQRMIMTKEMVFKLILVLIYR